VVIPGGWSRYKGEIGGWGVCETGLDGKLWRGTGCDD